MYINTFKPGTFTVDVEEGIEALLSKKFWGSDDHPYSAFDVLKNKKKFAHDYKKILNADLSYPIIIYLSDKYNSPIVDGMHRLAKLYLEKGKRMKCYLFDDALMEKFIVDKNANWDKLLNTRAFVLLEIFRKNFDICTCDKNNKKLSNDNIHGMENAKVSLKADQKNNNSIEVVSAHKKKSYVLNVPQDASVDRGKRIKG
jgi:disulfide oxidoreductase YuzD